ncbi:hypothetical protein AN3867.2 [Aspergillus nidulans FGSC A4]|uniref:Protein farnesyltransferase/geranylgeranyltransferase type-1 subunit alpha n=1 Tax=Emericella nidulans (strain FGSC A4 / ATCC 38163 / CBS 112.46 / NRRL 194 / M139) TaxID=227321 RepID=Q5B6G3_EMENI|nr:bifunctional protein farnesyltransferase/protein geranylgeranyltransferase [Aspergillus nidulans FGSC A4]EAA59132.1 hypothetical protein AN3867.2 [Aspergillus nidulans FGSC A4]CBF75207.1 TPA: hypothetical protein similar to TPA: CaaX farnesyltransferase alpha subunit (Broad) [Aspergillus nidulans FGSC A4]|eukprot:XP_661471.1 hypothetical protein AN3867.2 [Aspergillus nidulans FGSC A4]
MGKYASDSEWASIDPIPLNDGSESGAMPLATIAYSEEYLEATSYLRAVMAANEMSDRALKLTEDIISMNPAHYTVWIYRAKIVFALNKDLLEELEWLNGVSLRYLKNYQIWHHRQVIMSSREHFPSLPPKEMDFLMEMFAQDSKNYHVWTYRHWLVRHFELWDSPRELADVNSLLNSDVRNNSAWNHHLVDEELRYAQDQILRAPENRSPWSYARGILRAASRPLSEWTEFAQKFVVDKRDDQGQIVDVSVKSSHAVEWLADVYADAEENGRAEAVRMLNLLKDKYDPIRKNYWNYRIRTIEAEEVPASAPKSNLPYLLNIMF